MGVLHFSGIFNFKQEETVLYTVLLALRGLKVYFFAKKYLKTI